MITATVTKTYTDLYFTIKREYDQEPDLSYLADPSNYRGLPQPEIDRYMQQDQEHIDAYNRGEWTMLGLVVNAWGKDERGQTEEIAQSSLWGIESDNDDWSTYERDLMDECRGYVRDWYGLDDSQLDELEVRR